MVWKIALWILGGLFACIVGIGYAMALNECINNCAPLAAELRENGQCVCDKTKEFR